MSATNEGGLKLKIISTDVPRSFPHYARAVWGLYQVAYARMHTDRLRSKIVPVDQRFGVLIPEALDMPVEIFHLCHMRRLVKLLRSEYSLQANKTDFGRHALIRAVEIEWGSLNSIRDRFLITVNGIVIYSQSVFAALMFRYISSFQLAAEHCPRCGKKPNAVVRSYANHLQTSRDLNR